MITDYITQVLSTDIIHAHYSKQITNSYLTLVKHLVSLHKFPGFHHESLISVPTSWRARCLHLRVERIGLAGCSSFPPFHSSTKPNQFTHPEGVVISFLRAVRIFNHNVMQKSKNNHHLQFPNLNFHITGWLI